MPSCGRALARTTDWGAACGRVLRYSAKACTAERCRLARVSERASSSCVRAAASATTTCAEGAQLSDECLVDAAVSLSMSWTGAYAFWQEDAAPPSSASAADRNPKLTRLHLREAAVEGG